MARKVPLIALSLAILTFAATFSAGVAAVAAPQQLSPVVQVAINYGPGKTVLVSGVIVGDGRFVLTQGNLLDGAYDTAVALSSGEVVEPAMEHVDERFNIALLRLPGAVKASLPTAAEVPAGELAAVVLGSPESFAIGRSSVKLVPMEGARRWKLVPSVPAAFRGGAIVDASSHLVGLVVEEAGEIHGVPVTEFLTASQSSRIAERVQSTLAEAAAAAATEKVAAEKQAAAVPAPPARPSLVAPVLSLGPQLQPALEAPPHPVAVETSSDGIDGILAGLPVASAPAPPPPAPMVRAAKREVAAKMVQPDPAPPATPLASKPAPAATPVASKPISAAPPPAAPAPMSPEAALAAWDARISAEPTNMELPLAFADVLLNARLYDRAIQVLESTLDRFPAAVSVYWSLGRAYWQRAMYKDDGTPRRSMDKKPYRRALWAFEAFLQVAPDDSRAAQVQTWIRLLKKADAGRYD